MTLVDLVNCDLAFFYGLEMSVLCAIHAVLASSIPVPVPVARITTLALDVSAFVFLMYLSAGVIIQYACLRLGRVCLSEVVSDEDAHRAILLAITALSVALTAAKWGLEGKSFFYLKMVAEEEEEGGKDGRLRLLLAVAAASVAVNLVLRSLLKLHKRGMERRLPKQTERHEQQRRFPLGCYALSAAVTLGLFSLLAASLRTPGEEEARFALMGVCCIAAPAWAVFRDGRMREYAGKRLARAVSAWRWKGGGARVGPVKTA